MKQRKNHKKKKNAQIKLQTYRSSDGDTILVGKNNKQNDYLTNKKLKNLTFGSILKIYQVLTLSY